MINWDLIEGFVNLFLLRKNLVKSTIKYVEKGKKVFSYLNQITLRDCAM